MLRKKQIEVTKNTIFESYRSRLNDVNVKTANGLNCRKKLHLLTYVLKSVESSKYYTIICLLVKFKFESKASFQFY